MSWRSHEKETLDTSFDDNLSTSDPDCRTCPRLWGADRTAGGSRLNKVIEALENGRPAVGDREWRFIDMEHSPFSGVRLAVAV